MTTINASANNQTYKGISGHGHTVGKILRKSQNADAKKFLDYLAAVADKTKGRSPFACAEPHAVAQALNAGASLDDIRLDFEAKEKSRTIEYCPNCSKWINYDDGSLKVDVIRGSEEIAPEKVTRFVNLSTLVDEALEKCGKKPTEVASPPVWGSKNWKTHFTSEPKTPQTYAPLGAAPPSSTGKSNINSK
jgi:hypothetical protein